MIFLWRDDHFCFHMMMLCMVTCAPLLCLMYQHANIEHVLLRICELRCSSRELLRLSTRCDSILGLPTAVVRNGGVIWARCDVAPLSRGQGVFPPGATSSAAVAVSWVVNHHHGGIHSCQRVHTALPCWVKPGGAEFQLIVAGHLDEGAPTKRPLEACSKPVATLRKRARI